MTSSGSGMVYVSVSRAQCALNAHGAHLTVDGKWGPSTDSAMINFVSRSFDYGYEYPPDGAAVVKVTPALSSALRCPTQSNASSPVPPSSTIGWWVAGALAAAGAALLFWRYRA